MDDTVYVEFVDIRHCSVNLKESIQSNVGFRRLHSCQSSPASYPGISRRTLASLNVPAEGENVDAGRLPSSSSFTSLASYADISVKEYIQRCPLRTQRRERDKINNVFGLSVVMGSRFPSRCSLCRTFSQPPAPGSARPNGAPCWSGSGMTL